MIFIIVPEYPEIISWSSIFNLAKRRILPEYKDKFNVYKIYTDYNEDEDKNIFSIINFDLNKDFNIRVKSIEDTDYSDNKELDKIIESTLLKLDKKNSVCIIPKSFYLTIARFMEPTIHIEFFRVIQDRTEFQLINTSIVPLKEFGTFKKEVKNYEIHSLYTDK